MGHKIIHKIGPTGLFLFLLIFVSYFMANTILTAFHYFLIKFWRLHLQIDIKIIFKNFLMWTTWKKSSLNSSAIKKVHRVCIFYCIIMHILIPIRNQLTSIKDLG